MRKILTALTLITSSFTGYSQFYIDVGAKGMLATTWLMNESILNNQDYIHEISMGGGPGFKLGFNFNPSVELVGEIFYFQFNQKFDITENEESWKKLITIDRLDLPLLLRRNSTTGSYFEVGGQYSITKGITETTMINTIDAMEYYDQEYWSAILSFGSYMMGWENFGISFGLRFVYSFNDITSSSGPIGSFTHTVTNLPSPKETTPLYAGFVLEFNYDLGYMSKSPCTGRRQFLFF
ncbi:MAG TPA: hypothetical protein EYM84_07710 [Flavobacteriales bacterium]|nr:hypothetical protein [Flavobacteriales bacterium]HIN40142.1 hypothetical protein [Flavobacteriales bacterium]